MVQNNRELPLLIIENLQYIYRPNFSGRGERFNDEGNRFFNAKIDPTSAEQLANDGWNIKWSKPGKEAPPEVVAEFVPEPFLEVTVGFKFRPPTIVLIRDTVPTPISERTVSLLDSTEFSNIDVVIRARYWENDSGSGYKAWLKSFYGTVEMDDLDRKYAHLTESSTSEEPTDEPPFEVFN